MAPTGLIVSEAVSNAYKFAFRITQRGNFRFAEKKGTIVHENSDDGKGFCAPLNLKGYIFGSGPDEGIGKTLFSEY